MFRCRAKPPARRRWLRQLARNIRKTLTTAMRILRLLRCYGFFSVAAINSLALSRVRQRFSVSKAASAHAPRVRSPCAGDIPFVTVVVTCDAT